MTLTPKGAVLPFLEQSSTGLTRHSACTCPISEKGAIAAASRGSFDHATLGRLLCMLCVLLILHADQMQHKGMHQVGRDAGLGFSLVMQQDRSADVKIALCCEMLLLALHPCSIP